MQSRYQYLLLDAANTLIHKPGIWVQLLVILHKRGIEIDLQELQQKHKLVSELIHFPDRTSKDFYAHFNAEVLLALGIIPEEDLLAEIHQECSYLPWVAFEDCAALQEFPIRKAILSNFNKSIASTINTLFSAQLFHQIIGSEAEGIGKPDLAFYQLALDKLEVAPEQILYIGDSLKLDIIPAQKLGMDAWLIDRINLYPHFQKRITSLNEIHQLLYR